MLPQFRLISIRISWFVKILLIFPPEISGKKYRTYQKYLITHFFQFFECLQKNQLCKKKFSNGSVMVAYCLFWRRLTNWKYLVVNFGTSCMHICINMKITSLMMTIFLKIQKIQIGNWLFLSCIIKKNDTSLGIIDF